MQRRVPFVFSTPMIARYIWGVAVMLVLAIALMTTPARSGDGGTDQIEGHRDIQSYTKFVQPAGHTLPGSELQIISFKMACYDLDILTAIVEASHKGKERFQAAWRAMVANSQCFQGRYTGAFIRVAAVMEWAKTGPVVLIELHDREGRVAYTWFPKEFWDRQGVMPVGLGV